MTDKQIKILCTGEITVDYRELRELQVTESGQKLKRTSEELINKLAYSSVSQKAVDLQVEYIAFWDGGVV